MAATQLILDALIQRLRQGSGRTDHQVVKNLQATYGCSKFTARSLLARAAHTLNLETRRWRIFRRQGPKPLPGETSGMLDNVVRLLEDSAAG